MWTSAEQEKAQEENHEKGSPTVGRIQSRGTSSTELHQKGNQGEEDENSWHDEA